MEEIIKAANLKKVYGLDTPYPKTALNGVSISVNKGTFACIMGTSGSGKTTLINILSTIDEATSGKLLIFDQNIVGLSDKEKANIRKRYMGFIFQDYNLIDSLKVIDNILFSLKLNKKNIINEAEIKQIISSLGIEELLDKGWTPRQILNQHFRYYRYEKMIRNAFIDRKIQNAPLTRPIYAEYHFGESGSGKTFAYREVCGKFGKENVYMFTDFDNNASGGLDNYITEGAPSVLFMDEFKGVGISYSKLLVMLNEYPNMQTHARYANVYNLWENFFITSIYAPEELFDIMVDSDKRKIDSYEQLRRRINKIVYHYRNDSGDFMTYSMDSKEYVDREDLLSRIRDNVDPDGFRKIATQSDATVPF